MKTPSARASRASARTVAPARRTANATATVNDNSLKGSIGQKSPDTAIFVILSL